MPSDFLEKTLEDIMVTHHHKLESRGFNEPFYDHIDSQFYLPSGKKIDIFTWQIRGGVLYGNIIELKKEQTNTDALWQGMEYLDEVLVHSYQVFDDIKLTLTIIGKEIHSNVWWLLSLNSPVLKLYDYDYNWDGISFTEYNFTSEKIIKETKLLIKQPYLIPEEKIYTPAIKFYNRLKELDLRVGTPNLVSKTKT